ncbi:MAG: pseudouridine synthase [Polyangiaceae bacterium]
MRGWFAGLDVACYLMRVPSSDAPRPVPRRLRKRVAEGLALSLAAVDECWGADRLRVITHEGDEPRRLSLEALIFEEDQVFLDGVAVGPAVALTHALLNKPKFVTSTANDPRGKSDLSPYLRAMPPGCFAVGRLDRETTGLLLFTNDGDLATAVLRPDHSTTKTYWLWIDEPIADDDARLTQLKDGIIHNGQLLAAKSASIRARSEYATELELTLTQGKKRQIRHMCRELDLHLVHLHRFRIGPISDAGLALGAWRLLEPSEVESLWEAAGGRSAHRQRKVGALIGHAAEARELGTPLARLERWLEQELTTR